MNEVIIKLRDGHPAGKRNRAGFTFTNSPQKITVSDDELNVLKKDKELIFCTKESDQKLAKGGEKTYKAPLIKTKKNIIAALEEKGVEFDPTAKKDELLALLDE